MSLRVSARLLSALAVFLAVPGSAAAGGGADARRGFVWGASIGPGSVHVDCAGCGDLAPLDGGLSLTAQAGAMLSPRLALLVEHWSVRWDGRDSRWFGDSEDHLIRESVTTAGGQLWLTRRFWVRGGVGVSRHSTDVDYRSLEGRGGPVPASAKEPGRPAPAPEGRAPALAAAAGYEVIYTPTFAVDFALRGSASRGGGRGVKTGTWAFTIGATWF